SYAARSGSACGTSRRSDRSASTSASRRTWRRSRAPVRITWRGRAPRAGRRFISASGRLSDGVHTSTMIRHENAKTRQRCCFVLLCFGGCCLALVAGTAIVSAETIDRVLAVVGGQVIMLTDVTAARDLGLQAADTAADPVRAILSKLIDRELILAEVDR